MIGISLLLAKPALIIFLLLQQFLPVPVLNNDQPEQAAISVVVYPPEIDTDYEKLCAVYSLIEQMRLEHNRQGEIARSDWGKYKDKWYLYSLRPKNLGGNYFSDALLPLLQEQNRLRDNIRTSYFTDKEWRDLDKEQKDAATSIMFGDKSSLKLLPTAATTPLLDELKSISLDLINARAPPDPTEDFTTYTEDDTGGYVTVTASKCDVVSMPRTADSSVYKSFGAGHFGDFEHLLTTAYTNLDSGTLAGYWFLSNGAHTWAAGDSANKGIYGYYYGTNQLGVHDFSNGNDDYTTSPPQPSYCTIERSGTTLTNKIYSDASRTSLDDTLTITCDNSTMEYIHGMTSRDGSGTAAATFYTEDLDLQEVVAGWTNIADVNNVDESNIGEVCTVAKDSIGEINTIEP